MKTGGIMKPFWRVVRRITRIALLGLPILALAQALPPPVDTGRVEIEAEQDGSSVVASQDYRPPTAFTYYSIIGEKIGATATPPTLTTVQTVIVPAQPPVDGQVTIQFAHDADYSAKHPTVPSIYAGWEPTWDAQVSYKEAKLTTIWDAGRVTYGLEAKAQTNLPAEQMTGRGFARLFDNAGAPTVFPVLMDGTAVTGATRGFGTMYWWPPRVPYRFLPGTAYYFYQDQADGRRVVYNVLHHRRVGDLREFYPIGELVTIGTPGSVGSPSRQETRYESATTTLDEGAAAAKLRALMNSRVFDLDRFEPLSDPAVEYAFTPEGASTSKLRYKLQIQPGLARTITWAESFTLEGESDPVDYQFFSETVSASATETAAHVIDPFELANPHRFGSRRGVYRIVPFEAAVTGDTNGDNRIVPPVSPVTPYRVEFADATPLGGDFRFQLNVNNDVDTQSEDPSSTEGGPDFANQRVDGAADLANFVPVYLEIGQLLQTLSPHRGFTYRLKQADGALNFVYTNLTQKTAFDFRMNPDSGFGPGFDQPARAASTQQVTAAGVDIFAGDTGSAAFRDLAIQNQGAIILVEARQTTTQPLVLEVSREDQVAVTIVLPLTIVSAQLLVDANRDGEIKADGSDATSVERPFRFWLNDDIDRGHTVDGDDHEEDDLLTSPDGKLDWEENRIQSRRDLEDYFRLWIDFSGLNPALKNGEVFLGLRWANTMGTPAVKLYPHHQTNGGPGYLVDETTATQQIEGSLVLGEFNLAIADQRDRNGTPSLDANPTQTLIEGSQVFVLPTWLFAGLSESVSKAYFLAEGCKPGQGQLQVVILKKDGENYTSIGDGPGVWLDLKSVANFYERWTAGDRNGGDPAASATRQRFMSRSGNSVTYEAGFAYPSDAPEEQKYILYVHGWNMQPEEKNRFAETAFKRLYWQGYKGRFGVFCWPTTYNFGALVKDDSTVKTWLNSGYSASTDPTNYDRGEWAAWKSSFPLTELLTTLRASYQSVNVVAHSMGNIVAGEALRRLAHTGATNVVDCYVASQAALPAHSYDGTVASNLLADVPAATLVAYTDGGHPETPNIYPDWLSENGGAAGRRVNFYNVNDFALWHDSWEANQFLKPDGPDDPDQPWTYKYLGEVNTVQDLFKRRTPVWNEDLNLGDTTNPQNRYEIMAFAAEARSRAVGATDSALGMTRAVDLTTIWPDDTGPRGSDGQKWGAHKWHSAQFRSTNMRQANYWKTLLGPLGFNLPITQ